MLISSMKSPVWENKSTTGKQENEKLQGSCKSKKNKNILRWYWTPCNIYKDEIKDFKL